MLKVSMSSVVPLILAAVVLSGPAHAQVPLVPNISLGGRIWPSSRRETIGSGPATPRIPTRSRSANWTRTPKSPKGHT